MVMVVLFLLYTVVWHCQSDPRFFLSSYSPIHGGRPVPSGWSSHNYKLAGGSKTQTETPGCPGKKTDNLISPWGKSIQPISPCPKTTPDMSPGLPRLI